MGIDARKFISIVESDVKESHRANNLNYKNLKKFIEEMGLIPYD